MPAVGFVFGGSKIKDDVTIVDCLGSGLFFVYLLPRTIAIPGLIFGFDGRNSVGVGYCDGPLRYGTFGAFTFSCGGFLCGVDIDVRGAVVELEICVGEVSFHALSKTRGVTARRGAEVASKCCGGVTRECGGVESGHRFVLCISVGEC